ncbi:MAG: CapA family protein, partial [Chitinivibrionales bacterium]|nr:CapA family protein [Chitinivibrionales bacterium]
MEQTSKNTAVTLCAVGDIMLGEDIHKLGRGVRSVWQKIDITGSLSHLKEALSADITTGNFECTVGSLTGTLPRQRAYVADPAMIQSLKSIGFTHLGMANNHVLDNGVEQALRTRTSLEQAGITVFGSENPFRICIKEKTIAIFTLNCIADNPNPTLFYADQIDQSLMEKIRSSTADIKIASIHWGKEYCLYPNKQQIDTGHQLIDNGLDLLLGSHPHVVQAVERYKNGLI